jgi:hypothetical protein
MLHAPAFRAFALVLAAAQDASPPPALELLDHARLAEELAAIAGAHPDVAQLLKLGESRAGRAIEGLRLAGAGAAEDPARPAILLVANVDGARVYASAVALHHARALAEGHASDEGVKSLLDTTTVFVVPRANPDAAEARFARPRREQRASGTGVDDDRDGRMGEDPAADLDGDGVIAWMRVRDADGEWREDATDPRALVKADRVKGEPGVFRLWPEGRDLDGDERVAEDDSLDARVDRNFPGGWEAHGKDAGLFPTDEPETRALCDFVLAHPELALVVLYDAQDSLVAEIKGVGDDAPSVKRIPPEGVLESDAKLLGELGKRYRKVTGSAVKAEGGERGTFARWCYEHRGLLTLSAALWDVPLEEKKADNQDGQKADAGGAAEAPKVAAAEGVSAAKPAAGPESAAKKADTEKKDGEGKGKPDDEPKPSDDAKRLKWIDAAGASEAWRFLPWHAYEHPELGPVEIGGLAPYARLEPPATESGALAAKHLAWFLSLGALLPRVQVAECSRERLGEGLERVTVVLQNDAYLPLETRSARRTQTIRPAKVTLRLPQAGQRLGGPPQEFVDDLPGSGGRKEFTWLVQGPEAMEIAVEVETPNAGTATRTATFMGKEEKK